MKKQKKKGKLLNREFLLKRILRKVRLRVNNIFYLFNFNCLDFSADKNNSNLKKIIDFGKANVTNNQKEEKKEDKKDCVIY